MHKVLIQALRGTGALSMLLGVPLVQPTVDAITTGFGWS